MTNTLPCGKRSAKATAPFGLFSRNSISAPKLTEAITGPISGSASECKPDAVISVPVEIAENGIVGELLQTQVGISSGGSDAFDARP